MNIQNIDTKTYVIDVSSTTANAAFDAPLAHGTTLIIYNDSTNPAHVVTGDGASAPTAVFPTSGTGQNGKVIASKGTASFSVNGGTKYISAIQASSGTGSIYISAGEGG